MMIRTIDLDDPAQLVDHMICYCSVSNIRKMRMKYADWMDWQKRYLNRSMIINDLCKVKSPSVILMRELMNCKGDLNTAFMALDSDTRLKLLLLNAIQDFNVDKVIWILKALGWREWIRPVLYGMGNDIGQIESNDLCGWINFYLHLSDEAIERDLFDFGHCSVPELLQKSIQDDIVRTAYEVLND